MIKKNMKLSWKWLIKGGPSGIGHLLLGIATLIIVLQGNGILNKILKIQSTSESIQLAVKEILDVVKKQRIREIVDTLSEKNDKNFQSESNKGEFLALSLTDEEIEISVDDLLQEAISSSNVNIYLPKNIKKETIRSLKKAKTKKEMFKILQKAIKVDVEEK